MASVLHQFSPLNEQKYCCNMPIVVNPLYNAVPSQINMTRSFKFTKSVSIGLDICVGSLAIIYEEARTSLLRNTIQICWGKTFFVNGLKIYTFLYLAREILKNKKNLSLFRN